MIVVFSDLDGTLLDEENYSFHAALPAIEQLRERGWPLVLCTSKTRAEVEPLREALRNKDPFVVENGGGIHIPGEPVVVLGTPYKELTRALTRASVETGVPVKGFHQMNLAEVMEATGLAEADAERARQREFDEPFLILEPAGAAELLDRVVELGLQWTKGGRFYHIMGANDKSAAVRLLIERYRKTHPELATVGLGDAPNDAGFLAEVDHAVVIRSHRSDELAKRVLNGVVTDQPGPAGWNEAILNLLSTPLHSA